MAVRVAPHHVVPDPPAWAKPLRCCMPSGAPFRGGASEDLETQRAECRHWMAGAGASASTAVNLCIDGTLRSRVPRSAAAPPQHVLTADHMWPLVTVAHARTRKAEALDRTADTYVGGSLMCERDLLRVLAKAAQWVRASRQEEAGGQALCALVPDHEVIEFAKEVLSTSAQPLGKRAQAVIAGTSVIGIGWLKEFRRRLRLLVISTTSRVAFAHKRSGASKAARTV